MNTEQINKLIDRYLSGECTAEERASLEQWYEDHSAGDAQFYGGDTRLVHASARKSLESVRRKIKGNVAGQGRLVAIGRRTRWMAAAAAVLLLLVGGWWFVQGSHSTQQLSIAATPKVQDVEPGGNKAILTLADGTQVILDSANNGAITKQGNVTVIKLEDGQLAYNASTTQPLNTSTITYNTVTTPRGGQYQLVLSDGTKVWLNAASSLKFPTAFVGSERRVEMTGEGYFEVAASNDPSGAKRRFIVNAGKMDVEVLGTHFNINAYADEEAVKTTLLEGKVRASFGGQSVILAPGQQVLVEHPKAAGSELSIQDHVDLEQVVAWKNGKFQFGESMEVQSIMRQLSRWYNIEVDYKGKIDAHIGGTISRDVNLSEVLHMLEMTGVVNFEVSGRKVVVLSEETD